jgi:hypothetical protein
MSLLTIVAGLLLAQTPFEQVRGPGKLVIETPSGAAELSLSDLVVVKLEFRGDLAVEPPKDVTRSPGWRVYKRTPPEERDSGKERTWTQTFWLAPLEPGELVLQIEPWKVRERQLAWEPVTLKVKSMVDTVEVASRRPITPIEELPPPRSGPWWIWLVAGVVGVTLFLGGWVWGRRRKPAPQAVPTLAERTLGQLDRLLARRLPEKQATTRFLALLTLILRGYLEKTLGLPARKLTTAELLPQLAKQGRLTPAISGVVRDVLERSDRIRFARAQTTVEECAELAGRVRRVIEISQGC